MAAVCAIGLAVTAAARGAEPTTRELAEQLNDLQAKVDRLEAARRPRCDTAADADVVANPVVAAVLADADRRSQLLVAGRGLTGGWNPTRQQFYLAADDGAFYLHPGIIFQFRGVGNFRERAAKGGSDAFDDGFEVRRAKFCVDGNAFSKDLAYRFQWQGAANGGALSLQLAYVQYKALHDVPGVPGGELVIQAGQFRDMVFKEEIVFDVCQLMVERSIANRFVGGVPIGPEMQGVDVLLAGDNNPLHAEAVLHKGAGGINTDFTNGRDIPLPAPPYFGVAGRVDYKLFGDWADTYDLTGRSSGKYDLLDVGAGADVTQAAGSTAVRWTADAQYQTARRATLLAAVQGDHFDFRRSATGPGARNDYGFMVEGGYALSPAWELTARYAVVRFDNRFKIGGRATFQEVSAGVIYFLGGDGAAGNHAKLSFDVNWLPDGVPDGAAGLDYLASPNGMQEVVARAQLQLFL